MRNYNGRGRLITIEGVTGSGKSFFTGKLATQIDGTLGRSALRLGGFGESDKIDRSEITRFLRQLMRTSRFIGLPWLSETTILLAEQAYNLAEYVQPALVNGDIILYENYDDALIVYQLARGESLGIPESSLLDVLNKLVAIQRQPFGYPTPDLTIYLRSPMQTICSRLEQRDGRVVPRKDKVFIQKVVRNYAKLYDGRQDLFIIDNRMRSSLAREVTEVCLRLEQLLGRISTK